MANPQVVLQGDREPVDGLEQPITGGDRISLADDPVALRLHVLNLTYAAVEQALGLRSDGPLGTRERDGSRKASV